MFTSLAQCAKVLPVFSFFFLYDVGSIGENLWKCRVCGRKLVICGVHICKQCFMYLIVFSLEFKPGGGWLLPADLVSPRTMRINLASLNFFGKHQLWNGFKLARAKRLNQSSPIKGEEEALQFCRHAVLLALK